MKNVDKLVHHMAHVVATCILIHNLYIIGNDSFDIDQIEEIERKLKRQIENK